MEIETLFSDFLQAEIFPWLCQERARKKLNSYRRNYPDFDQKLNDIGLQKGKKKHKFASKKAVFGLLRGVFWPPMRPPHAAHKTPSCKLRDIIETFYKFTRIYKKIFVSLQKISKPRAYFERLQF